MKRITWLIAPLAALLLSASAFGAVDDPNGKGRVSLYAKNTIVGDTAVAVSSAGYIGMDLRLIAGTAADVNSGNKSAGTLRVVVATDQPAFSVNATLAAETTKVIGTVRMASGGVASGSFASGALASGSIASGACAAGCITAGPTSFVKNEDVASASGDAGVPAEAIQQTTPADTAVDGDYSMLQMKNGLLFVDPSKVTSPVSAASLPLPALAATSTKQSDGTQKTQIVDGSGSVIASTSNNLNVQCANCSGAGASAADEASFTAGTSTFAPSGCFFQTTGTSNALTTGQQGQAQCTANRAWFTNLRNAAGTEVGTSTTPLQVTLANTGANGTAVKVDGSAVTQPVSISGNQAVNEAQINGVTPLMGNGASGTGAQRVTISSDNTVLPGVGAGATGSAVPANAVYSGLSDGTNLRGELQAANALNSTGTGIATAQAVGQFDDVSPTSITENQFGNLRMSANRNLYGTIRDAAGNERGANVSAGNALLTDSSATTQPVSGTVTANAGTNLNTSALALDATAAKLNNAQAATTSGETGPLVQGAVTTAAPAYTTAQTDPLSLTTAGGLRIDLKDTVSNTNNLNVNIAASGASNISTNVAQMNGVATTMGNGVSGTGVQRVTIASDSTGQIALATGANTIGALTANQSVNIAQMNGVTTTMGNGVSGTGVQRVTIASDSTGQTALAAGSNTVGNVVLVPSATAGGTTPFTLTLANSTNATNVKASAGQLYGLSGFSLSSATPVFISLYDTAGTPTCGTSIKEQYLIPGSTTGTGLVLDFSNPVGFASGIGFCVTTGIAGTGAVAASNYVLNLQYK